MKTSDIIVGAKYTNFYTPGVVWFGVGMRKLWTGKDHDKPIEWIEKHLIDLESGYMAQEGENACEGFWEAFQKIKDNP